MDPVHKAKRDNPVTASRMRANSVGATASANQEACEFLIVGAGITGLTIARELLQQGARGIIVIDKEEGLGTHASGRNSGVLHAGIYYTPDSMKARFCAEGNRLMKDFCRAKGLALNESGKVIVARDEAEQAQLEELKRRADRAGANARLIDEAELARLEPHARTAGVALHSPDTAVVDPKEILRALAREITESGRARIFYDTAFVGADDTVVQTSRRPIRYETVINAAGAYADRVAQAFGVGPEFKLIPFKGTYKEVPPHRAFLCNSNIYPVPDLNNPFLGVHFTRGVSGHVHVGPTALPAFGREHYGKLKGWTREAPAIMGRNIGLVAKSPAFRAAAKTEPRKYLKGVLYREAKRLVPELERNDLQRSRKVGVRPQLVHWPTRQLVMDFVVLKEGAALHVLNAVSPAFTSSMAFARHAVGLLGDATEWGAAVTEPTEGAPDALP
jgi:(S)-2-hydroxyglutarate dehydrogenase